MYFLYFVFFVFLMFPKLSFIFRTQSYINHYKSLYHIICRAEDNNSTPEGKELSAGPPLAPFAHVSRIISPETSEQSTPDPITRLADGREIIWKQFYYW